MEKSQVNAKSIVISVILLCVIVFMGVSYFMFRPKVVVGEKNISVTVVHKDGSKRELDITTDEQYLRMAVDPEGLVEGQESEYGLFLTTVDGETVDTANEEWWGIFKDGQLISFGIDKQPIRDGEHYSFEFITGYDNY